VIAMSTSALEDSFIVVVDDDPPLAAPRAPSPPPAQPLFRPEVLAERQTQRLGTVLLAPRLSHRLCVAFAVAVTGAVAAALVTGSYSRKARVSGWLVPREGLVQVFAPVGGIAIDLRVEEGQEVAAGDPLLVLSSELQSAALGATRREGARRLAARRDSLRHERTNVALLADLRAFSVADRLSGLRSERAQLEREVELQRARLTLAERSLARALLLRREGLASDQAVDDAEAARMDHEARLCALERDRTSLERDRLAAEHERDQLPLTAHAELAALERTIASLEQELAETEAQRELVVTAPVGGTVTSLQVVRGGAARPDVPLLSLLPAGGRLEAQLFGASRAVGLLRPGQRVLLRYAAYPYQKFGHQEGVVEAISRSAVNPGELPAQLAGLTSLFDPGEPLYRIRVGLTRQAVSAYGESAPLLPGMQLEADVVIDRRPLVDWVLDPLRALAAPEAAR
jgi:membrane fusion protein